MDSHGDFLKSWASRIPPKDESNGIRCPGKRHDLKSRSHLPPAEGSAACGLSPHRHPGDLFHFKLIGFFCPVHRFVGDFFGQIENPQSEMIPAAFGHKQRDRDRQRNQKPPQVVGVPGNWASLQTLLAGKCLASQFLQRKPGPATAEKTAPAPSDRNDQTDACSCRTFSKTSRVSDAVNPNAACT